MSVLQSVDFCAARRQVECGHTVVNGGALTRDVLARAVIGAAHQTESRVSSFRPAPGQVSSTWQRTGCAARLTASSSASSPGLCAEGIMPARDDAQDTHHVARRGKHGDLAALRAGCAGRSAESFAYHCSVAYRTSQRCAVEGVAQAAFPPRPHSRSTGCPAARTARPPRAAAAARRALPWRP